MNDKQTVELFHLLFLDWLGRKMDKRRYADPQTWEAMVLTVAEALRKGTS